MAKIKPDAEIKAMVTRCYPDYAGRKFRIAAQVNPLNVASYWDGGSRDYFAFYCLTTGKVVPVPAQSAYDKKLPGADRVMLPDGIVCIERSFFCGKDIGITVHVNPANLTKFLPEAA
jgi:hypothetical protein